MSLIAYIVLLAVGGLFVGALARLALPGSGPLSLLQTMLVGIAGSAAAGAVYALLFHPGGGGILLSALFAAAIVYMILRARGGSLTRPGRDERFGTGPRRAGLFR
jgi:uncharacterized membrane protein YeaQ/YmgE (transglycosylase-associated protein family)